MSFEYRQEPRPEPEITPANFHKCSKCEAAKEALQAFKESNLAMSGRSPLLINNFVKALETVFK